MRADEAPRCRYLAQQRVQLLSRTVAFERIDPHQCAIDLHKLRVNLALHFLAIDRGFCFDAERSKLEITPVPGERIQALVAELYKTPPELTKRLAEMLR